MTRYTYIIERMPVEPCEQHPQGVPGHTLTAVKDEAAAQQLVQQITDDEEHGYKYRKQRELLQ